MRKNFPGEVRNFFRGMYAKSTFTICYNLFCDLYQADMQKA